ncbi:MAG: PAS domain S-box protein [Rubrivivax sp.]|nr:PAS domain S-box protein [Rubrivivax sp.]
MSPTRPAPSPSTPRPSRWTRRRRALLWAALLCGLVVAQSLLVGLTVSYEASRTQETTDAVAVEVAAELRRKLVGLQQQLQSLAAEPPERWATAAAEVLRRQRLLLRAERRDATDAVAAAVDSPFFTRAFMLMRREDSDVEAEQACAAARRTLVPAFSRSYFVPLPGGFGQELLDLCVPVTVAGEVQAYVVGTLGLGAVLEAASTPPQTRGHELSFVEGDGTRLVRAGLIRGAGVFRAERLVDLPGTTLQLRVDSATGAPRLIPNLSTALVLGLSIGLFALVLLLAYDVQRRAVAERALAEALAFRKAMEDSLVTGLRARDLRGRITYVNPAFCTMVGFAAEELLGADEPPYWPPEHRDDYRQRQAVRLSPEAAALNAAAREGFETEFMRRDGERFPVMIYEAPLVDGGGQTGWMSAVLDLSAQRSVEELSRQQQERLQATARLATVGEMASLLSHELNQPLAAIASYASGSLNLLDAPDDQTPALLGQALARIQEQAERAGRVIKSVHDFVRRREQLHEALGADVLIEAVLPLVRLQARKSGTRIELDLPTPAPRVRCDRTMLEQVLLNLTRNGIQSMEEATPLAERVLRIVVRQTHPRWVTFSVADAGPGIPPEVAARLFTPFYTTRREGMGLGLSLCRTVIEQHGGALDFGPLPAGAAGTEFRFTLPAARVASSAAAPASETTP